MEGVFRSFLWLYCTRWSQRGQVGGRENGRIELLFGLAGMRVTSWVAVQMEWGTCGRGQRCCVDKRGLMSSVFYCLTCCHSFFLLGGKHLFFYCIFSHCSSFPKIILPNPLIFCLIKPCLSLAQCAKLMGLWGISDPLLGELGGGCPQADHCLWTES